MNATVLDTNTSTLTTNHSTEVSEPQVVVRGTGRSFVQEVRAGDHRFKADEPVGTDVARSLATS